LIATTRAVDRLLSAWQIFDSLPLDLDEVQFTQLNEEGGEVGGEG